MKRLRWLAVPAMAAVLFGAVSCGGGSDDKTSSDILASGEYTLNGWSSMKVVDFTALSSARLARIGSVSVKYSINLEEANADNTVQGAFFLSSSADETALYGEKNANVVGSEINASSTTEATVEIPFANDGYNTTAKTLAFCNKSYGSGWVGVPAVVNIISVTYNGLSTMEKATSATANNFAEETDSTVYMYTYDAQTGRDVTADKREEYLASLENLSSTVTAYESTYNDADAVLLKAGAGNDGTARLTYIFDGSYTISENTYFQMNASAGGNVSVLFWDTKTDEESGKEIYDSAYLTWTESKKISLGEYSGKKLRGVEYAGNAGTYIYGWSIGSSTADTVTLTVNSIKLDDTALTLSSGTTVTSNTELKIETNNPWDSNLQCTDFPETGVTSLTVNFSVAGLSSSSISPWVSLWVNGNDALNWIKIPYTSTSISENGEYSITYTFDEATELSATTCYLGLEASFN
ncbi:putative membrane protein YkoI [Treponema rectale]|uniref:Putative membrane protein YkoI n=1 Tax=Treponema rectale TaxID=744512 RepID=A0A840SF69_9SPIR|nr:hypothetical protein [Treponema rectale]MBB5219534.1 putative membrane protein YkoI [Treponema rectale]